MLNWIKSLFKTNKPSQFDLLVEAVCFVESNNNPLAVSPAGAQGLMQLMPKTGEELFKKSGLSGVYNPFNPEQNKILGRMYLKELYQIFNDTELMLAAYNAGPGNVKKWIRNYGKTWRGIEVRLKEKNSYKETIDYVNKVLAKWDTLCQTLD